MQQANPMFYISGGSKPVATHGKGVYLYGDDGRQYLDASSGAIVCHLGHAHPNILEAQRRQAESLHYCYRTQFENAPAIALAQKLVALAPEGLDRVFFVSGGSEAVESAVKLVRQYHVANGDTERSVFISRRPSYHGSTLGALALTSYTPLNAPFAPMVQIYPKVASPTQYRLPDGINAEQHALNCAEEIRQAIESLGAHRVAGLIAEPIGGASTGAEVPHDAYFPRVQEICRAHEVPIILDEVLTGMGRTGKWFASEHWQVDADVVCLAKGLGAGYYPIGAVLAKNALVEPVLASGGFMHGFTYAGNPMACATGLAVLDTIGQNGLIGQSAALGRWLKAEIEALTAPYHWVGDVRGRGLLMAIEFADRDTRAPHPNALKVSDTFTQTAYQNGLIVYPRKSLQGVEGDHVLIAPPLILSQPEASDLLARLDTSLGEYDAIFRRAG